MVAIHVTSPLKVGLSIYRDNVSGTSQPMYEGYDAWLGVSSKYSSEDIFFYFLNFVAVDSSHPFH